MVRFASRQQSLRLIDAHHERKLPRLTNVIDLFRKIQSPQRHPEQEPQPGHPSLGTELTHTQKGK
jgi:hypothetical protein